MNTDRRTYRVDTRTRLSLYHQALASIPVQFLPPDDVQRLIEIPSASDEIYYKIVETPAEDARARAVWYCSYMAANCYTSGNTYEETVLSDAYERQTDSRWIGTTIEGKVVATARSLVADALGHFQIHEDKAGFGPLGLPPGSIYGSRLPATAAEIAVSREVSAFAVDLGARSWQRNALIGLIKTVLNGFQEMGVRHVYTSIDESFFLLVNHMGLHLEQIGQKNVYMGSVVVPAFFEVDGMIENLRPNHPALHEFMKSSGALPRDSRYTFYRRSGTISKSAAINT